MRNLIPLNLKTKETDQVKCIICNEGIMIPLHPESEINHGFKCSKCDVMANIDADVIVE